jgi:hypothetical protein
MTLPIHVMPFEKRFLMKWFSPQISPKPPSPQETKHKKEREKNYLNKKKENKRKKKKSSKSLFKQRESQYSERRKTLQLQKYLFWCDSIFTPSIIPFQKHFLKSLRKFS